MERTIGEVFTINGLEYKVVKDDMRKPGAWNCLRCAFTGWECVSNKRKRKAGECQGCRRKDCKNVHFERV